MKTLTRSGAIGVLRDYLMTLTDDKHSVCDVAATKGILCHGFQRLSADELRKKFDWIVQTRPGATRAQLEELANKYNLARQEALEVNTACDALQIDRDTCMGWDEFSNADLARYYQEIFHESLEVTADP